MQSLISQPFFIMKRSETFKWKINEKLLLVFCLMLTFIFLFIYIFQIQTLIKIEYQKQIYQKQIKNFSEIVSMLEIKSASFDTLENTEGKINELKESVHFVKVEQIKYIPIPKEYLVEGR